MREGLQIPCVDGDRILSGPNQDLGLTREDRIETIRHIHEVSPILTEEGFIVIVACTAPLQLDREWTRRAIGTHFMKSIVGRALLSVTNKTPRSGTCVSETRFASTTA